MAHRALVAYERSDGRYALHYAHWGATDFGLVDAITAETPFGGGTTRSGTLLDRLRAALGIEECGGYLAKTDRSDTVVEPEPIATGCTFEEIIEDHIDFQLYEAVYIVTATYRVTPYLPLWFGLADVSEVVERSPHVGNGALVALHRDDTVADADTTRRWFRGAKAVVGRLVDEGTISEANAVDRLIEAVTRRVDDEREVVIARHDPDD